MGDAIPGHALRRDTDENLHRFLRGVYHIPQVYIATLEAAEESLQGVFTEIDRRAALNQLRLLHIFQSHDVTDFHLNGSTGYGYGDSGREMLEQVFASYFGGETALVRSQIQSGTHAIALGLYGNLKPGDELICAVGPPYDTLQKVIGLHGETDSLIESGVSYREIPLAIDVASRDMPLVSDTDSRETSFTPDVGYQAAAYRPREGAVVDLPRLLEAIGSRTKMVFLQRSKGYHWRSSVGIDELERILSAVKAKKPDVICIVDNCYCEMTETREPGEVGADLVIGSLIKNPGGTLAPCGGYIVGKAPYVEACVRRLTAPGLSPDLGASLGFNRPTFQGLYQAPQVVSQSMKGAVLAGAFFGRLGYAVMPASMPEPPLDATPNRSVSSPSDYARTDEVSRILRHRTDIVQAIRLGSEDKLLRFCRAIQKACPLDASFAPEPAMLPGYSHPVIMAGGGFIQGSSSELSADGPVRPPYDAFLQGGFSLAQIRLGLLLAATDLDALAPIQAESGQ